MDRSCVQLQLMNKVFIQATQVGFLEGKKPPKCSWHFICPYLDWIHWIVWSNLGGPFLRERDGTLLGVLSSFQSEKNIVYQQFFTKIHRYFDWISEVTGMELPKCQWFFGVVSVLSIFKNDFFKSSRKDGVSSRNL